MRAAHPVYVSGVEGRRSLAWAILAQIARSSKVKPSELVDHAE